MSHRRTRTAAPASLGQAMREVVTSLATSTETALTTAAGALDALELFVEQYRAGEPITDEDLATISASISAARANIESILARLMAAKRSVR